MLYVNIQLDEKTERLINEVTDYVDDLLKYSGVSKEGTQQLVWVVLHHHFTAIKMCEQLCDEDKALIAAKQKLLRNFFTVRCNLKEKKRKREKEGSSLQPYSKEKEKKEKDQKTLSLAGREISTLDEGQQAFWEECRQYIGHPYDEEMVQAFFYYWAERSIKNGKMRWETKRTWGTHLRLAGWSKKQYSYNDRMASSRYSKFKKKQTEETAATSKQQIVAHREQETIRREEELQQAKENSVSLEQYLAEHPESNLKMFSNSQS